MRTGFLSKNHFKNRNNRISLPVILAACLFLASVFCYITFSASSRAQAERIVKKLFTSESYRELEEAANIGLPQMYDTHFPGDFTPEGRDSLLPVGIPYTLFLEQFPSPVERIYAQEPVLALEEAVSYTHLDVYKRQPQRWYNVRIACADLGVRRCLARSSRA